MALDAEDVFGTSLGMHTPEGKHYVRLGLAVLGAADVLTGKEITAIKRAAIEAYVRQQGLLDSVAAVESGPGFDPQLSGPQHGVNMLAEEAAAYKHWMAG